MTRPAPTRRSNSAPGVKALITATSLLATIGGWAILASHAPASEVTQGATPATDQQSLMAELPPLPTLIPEGNVDVSAVQAPAPAPTPRNVAGLRRVETPPRPLTTTRSSR